MVNITNPRWRRIIVKEIYNKNIFVTYSLLIIYNLTWLLLTWIIYLINKMLTRIKSPQDERHIDNIRLIQTTFRMMTAMLKACTEMSMYWVRPTETWKLSTEIHRRFLYVMCCKLFSSFGFTWLIYLLVSSYNSRRRNLNGLSQEDEMVMQLD